MKKNLLIDVAILSTGRPSYKYDEDVELLYKNLREIKHHTIRIPEFSGLLNAEAVEKIVRNQIERGVALKDTLDRKRKRYKKKLEKDIFAIVPFGCFYDSRYGSNREVEQLFYRGITSEEHKIYKIISWSVIERF